MDLLDLVRSKTQCLEYFRKVTAQFLEECRAGSFERLQDFQTERESSLRLITWIDQKIDFCAARIDKDSVQKVIDSLSREEEFKKSLVSEILKLDREVMLLLETEKEKTRQEILKQSKSKEAIGKFKSDKAPSSGDRIDETL